MDVQTDRKRENNIPAPQTQYNKSYPIFAPNFKTLGAIIPEKCLTEKVLTNRHIYGKANYKCQRYNKLSSPLGQNTLHEVW